MMGEGRTAEPTFRTKRKKTAHAPYDDDTKTFKSTGGSIATKSDTSAESRDSGHKGKKYNAFSGAGTRVVFGHQKPP